ncbi:MAG TPA: DUF2283 domain-containing protein [Solirubrobacterales bacterium]|jgi:uncharacterized protein YuzE
MTQLAHYDPHADTAFFKVRDEAASYTVPQEWGGVFGFNEAGYVVSVEISFASSWLPEPLVAVLPRPGPDKRRSSP